MGNWLMQLNMVDAPGNPRWITLYAFTTRHKAETQKRECRRRSPEIKEYFRVIREHSA